MRSLTTFLASVPKNITDNIGPKLAFNAGQSKDGLEILVHGVIGEDYDGLDSASLVKTIKSYQGDQITLDINTPGGSVFDAMSIYNALVAHPANVEAFVTGAAFSAGTIVASAADDIMMGAGSEWWVHRAWALAMGNAPIMQEAAEMLGRADRQIADLLAERSGNSLDQVLGWMQGSVDGTSFNAQETVDAGFASGVLPFKSKKEPAPDTAAASKQREFYNRQMLIHASKLHLSRQ